MMQLLDDGTAELLLKDFQLNHSMIRRLISELVLRAQAEAAAQANSNKSADTSNGSRDNPDNFAAALRFALISGGWDVCTMCPGGIPHVANSTSSAQRAGTAGGGSGSNGRTAPSGDSSIPTPGLNSAKSVAELDTASASIAAAVNAGVTGHTSAAALGAFGNGQPSFGSELSADGIDPMDLGGLATEPNPEPGTWFMVGGGLLLCWFVAKRRAAAARKRVLRQP
jgi:hypothetical protein